jgi:curli biogenesis system outer membrane secretion channel CsgG
VNLRTLLARIAPAVVPALVATMLVATPAAAEYVAYAHVDEGALPLPEAIDDIDPTELIDVRWGEYAGPQIRVGVLPVENNSGASTSSFRVTGPDGQTVSEYKAEWDFNREVPVNGIEAMISDVMLRSGRFRVVERAALDSVLSEQDLVTSGRIAKPSGAKTGQVLGAEFLVQAVITSYEPDYKGKKVGLGGITGGLLGGAKVGKSRSLLGMNIRVIDSETSELLFSKQVDAEVSKRNWGFGGVGWGSAGALGGFMESYSKTPIGQAVMAAVNMGVFELVKYLGERPVAGSVVKVDGSRVFVNLGEDVVQNGVVLEAFRKGEELIDPDTGSSLGGEEERVGSLAVQDVKEKYCIAAAQGWDPSVLERGDKIVSTAPPAKMEFASAWQGKFEKKKKKKKGR